MNFDQFCNEFGEHEGRRVLQRAGRKESNLYAYRRGLRRPSTKAAQAMVAASGGRLDLLALLAVKDPSAKKVSAVRPLSDARVSEMRIGEQLAQVFGTADD